jgi:hypothetical protein
MWTTLYRLRDPDDVVAEIEEYRRRYAITSLQLYDLTAITKKSWTVEFAHKLLARGIDLKCVAAVRDAQRGVGPRDAQPAQAHRL